MYIIHVLYIYTGHNCNLENSSFTLLQVAKQRVHDLHFFISSVAM